MNENDTLNLLRTSVDSNWHTHGLPSRASLFGDGIFETMIYINGKIRFAPAHQNRVNEGVKALKLDASGMADVPEIEKLIEEKVDESQRWRIRWNIFRSGQGKYTPEENHCSEQLMIQPFTIPPKIKNNAYLSNTIQLHPSPWSHCKTLNCLPYVMANLERKEKNMDEVILTDENGYLSEAGASNLFWISSGTFFTPSLRHHAISGVGRAQIIELLTHKKIPFLEGSFTKEHLLEADQVFTSNVTGISYIREIEHRSFGIDPIPLLEKIFQ
ncbi:aminotransferase class IV [Lunatibacter salilacus]|uniref:aminotransferase class IV n=1 Tax=Lunatibacter salilacus TaxID=2483804 RepID=UPI00131C7A00|nr:aminotransferase class IV [Lunatibacter salilacus]